MRKMPAHTLTLQIAAIAASIKEWGWTTPVLVGDDGGLIAGHARVLAARQLGIAEIPVMVAAGWSEAQKRAYVLAGAAVADLALHRSAGHLAVDHRRDSVVVDCHPFTRIFWPVYLIPPNARQEGEPVICLSQ